MNFEHFAVKAEIAQNISEDFENTIRYCQSSIEEDVNKIDELEKELKEAEEGDKWRLEAYIKDYNKQLLRYEIKIELHKALLKALEKELKS